MIKLIKYIGILYCLMPLSIFAAEATINNGINISAYKEVPIISNNTASVGGYFSMNNFVDDEEYKIEIIEDAPNLAQNVQIAVGGSTTGSNVEFTWHTNDQFLFTAYISSTTPINSTQLIKFRIFRKGLFGIWSWESSFFYYLNTVCKVNENLVQTPWPLTAMDYEVSGNLEVSSTTNINTGTAEFDGGNSVTFLPGFSSTLVNGGAILAINDGCGGAFRILNNSVQQDTPNEVAHHVKLIETNIFPNPTNGLLKIQINNKLDNVTRVIIKDFSGKTIIEKPVPLGSSLETLDLGGFKSGLYICQLLSENQVIKTIKLSIN